MMCAPQVYQHHQANDRVDCTITRLKATDACVVEPVAQCPERPIQVKRVQHNESRQGTRKRARQSKIEKQGMGQRKKYETRYKRAPLAEDHCIGPDLTSRIALIVPKLLGQMTCGKRQRKKAGGNNGATINHACHRITEKEMESSTDEVKHGTENRFALPVELRKRIEGARGCDSDGQAERNTAKLAEEKQAQGQQNDH